MKRWRREKKEKRKEKKEKNGVFSGHYVIASSLPPERLRQNDDRWNAARSCQFSSIMRGFLIFFLHFLGAKDYLLYNEVVLQNNHPITSQVTNKT